MSIVLVISARTADPLLSSIPPLPVLFSACVFPMRDSESSQSSRIAGGKVVAAGFEGLAVEAVPCVGVAMVTVTL